MLDLKRSKFLDEDQIREICPSAFTTSPSGDVTKHYTHIPTSRVIHDMSLLGWKVVDAKEVKARKEKTVGFQKHVIVFRNPDVTINSDDGDDVSPQILLTNSHNGKNSFGFQAGIYRAVCENGLVVSKEEYESLKIRHLGYTFEQLQEKVKDIVVKLPLTVESMEKMKNVELSQEKSLEFANRALLTRFSDDDINSLRIDVENILKPARDEDRGNDLWKIFNVVQEKITKGGFEYTYKNKRRKAREIKSFIQDQKINENLFSLALEYVN